MFGQTVKFLSTKMRIAISLCASALMTIPASAADQRQCEDAVNQRHYSRLSSVCIDLPHRNRMEKMRLLKEIYRVLFRPGF